RQVLPVCNCRLCPLLGRNRLPRQPLSPGKILDPPLHLALAAFFSNGLSSNQNPANPTAVSPVLGLYSRPSSSSIAFFVTLSMVVVSSDVTPAPCTNSRTFWPFLNVMLFSARLS